MVLVIQGNTVHHYHFKVDPNGKGEVVWSTARPGFLSKGSLFVHDTHTEKLLGAWQKSSKYHSKTIL